MYVWLDQAGMFAWVSTVSHTDKKHKVLSKQIVFCHVNAPVIQFILGHPDERLEVMQ